MCPSRLFVFFYLLLLPLVALPGQAGLWLADPLEPLYPDTLALEGDNSRYKAGFPLGSPAGGAPAGGTPRRYCRGAVGGDERRGTAGPLLGAPAGRAGGAEYRPGQPHPAVYQQTEPACHPPGALSDLRGHRATAAGVLRLGSQPLKHFRLPALGPEPVSCQPFCPECRSSPFTGRDAQ